MAKSKFATKINNKRIAAHQATYAEKDAYGDDIHASLANKADKSEIPVGVPVIASEDEGKVLKVDHGAAVWGEGGGGGGGGNTPIEITPEWNGSNNTFTVNVPSNNATFFAILPDKGEVSVEVEIVAPTLGSGEIYNFTVVIINEWEVGYDHHMSLTDPSGLGRIRPTDDTSLYGNVYGNSTTKFVVLGNGYTMTTTAYQYG